jgi:hypothetical protein
MAAEKWRTMRRREINERSTLRGAAGSPRPSGQQSTRLSYVCVCLAYAALLVCSSNTGIASSFMSIVGFYS